MKTAIVQKILSKSGKQNKQQQNMKPIQIYWKLSNLIQQYSTKKITAKVQQLPQSINHLLIM